MNARTKAYQVALARWGLYTGAIDGISGPKTIAAIQSFQRLHAAEPTGVFLPAQVRQLEGTFIPTRIVDRTNPYPHDDTASLIAFYGQPGDTSKHVLVDLPFPMFLAWDQSKQVNKITLHSRCAESFVRFFEDIKLSYTPTQIKNMHLDQYGGSYNNRPIRGGVRPSTHAFACAIDYAPAQNQLRWKSNKAIFAKPEYAPVLASATQNNLTNLGAVENFDYMHFQAAWRK